MVHGKTLPKTKGERLFKQMVAGRLGFFDPAFLLGRAIFFGGELLVLGCTVIIDD